MSQEWICKVCKDHASRKDHKDCEILKVRYIREEHEIYARDENRMVVSCSCKVCAPGEEKRVERAE